MKYYFENNNNLNKLRIALIEWIGTPYRHWCGVKGLGTDCIHFVVRIMEEIGAIPKIKIPEYPRDWHLHRSEELLLSGIKTMLNVDEIDITNSDDFGSKTIICDGDIILFQYGRTASHSAIYFDGSIYEALTNRKVEKTTLTNDKKKRARHIFRLKYHE